MTVSSYRSALKPTVRALWLGVWTAQQFNDEFKRVIQAGLTQAWADGMEAGGISMTEQTLMERMQLRVIIASQQVFVSGFADAIIAGSKMNGGKLGPLLSRLEMWINVYPKTVDQAKARALADQKVMWFLGARKKHCGSCSGFNGRVYRRSTWAANNALPRSLALG